MDRIRIHGGTPLRGSIRISGAKNAALPLMAASLLTDDTLILVNVPQVVDIATMANLLAQHGVTLRMDASVPGGGHTGHALELSAGEITNTVAPYDLVRRMRASVLVLGPLVSRVGEARVSLPGGCAIGTRPVDLHLKALGQLGAQIDLADGYIAARAPHGLVGGHIVFPFPSVGATENLMMAATLARGETVLVNVAREPEIVDLARCLGAMGADISGAGSDTIHIRGVSRLHGATHAVIPDRIEVGTFAIAAAITDGDITLESAQLEHIEALEGKLGEAGVEVSEAPQGLRVRRVNGTVKSVDVTTEPFPGFPTDLQAQMMALMATASGASLMTETIFENRFMHVPELMRMGADVKIQGATALIRGVARLAGAPVMATDLRASVSLVLAGLAAEGETVVNRVYHLDRGYERIEEKLAACGAVIERLRANE